jgi:hypothetical protein
VIHSESAIGLTLDNHPDKPSRLTNLGNCLLRRFERLGDLTDISQAVATFEAAVTLIPEGHPDKPALLNNLGTSLLRRFEQLGNLTDISPAVAQFKAAVELTPDGHPNKPQFLTNLGKSLSYRFEQLHEPHDYQELLSKYTQAACSETGAAHVRFEAASRWAYSAQLVEHPSLLQAYDRTIELLPELAWLGLSIGDRHRLILEAGLVVRDAAAAAIGAHKWSTAVEWLEQGRSIIWGQILNLRTPVDDLRKHHPELADELLSLSMQLERAGTRSSSAEVYPPQLLQSVAQKSHVIAVERDQLLKKIRQLAGFERFLLSKPISELSFAATLGPVVLLNGSQYQCDALILMPGCRDEVIHIPLPNFTLDDAQALRKSLGSVVRGAARSNRLEGQREGQLPPDEEFSNILSVLWGRIVEPVLDGLSMVSHFNELI